MPRPNHNHDIKYQTQPGSTVFPRGKKNIYIARISLTTSQKSIKCHAENIQAPSGSHRSIYSPDCISSPSKLDKTTRAILTKKIDGVARGYENRTC